MTIEQILELGKMGYTKEEIEAMEAPAEEPAKEPEPQKAPEQPKETEKPAPNPQEDLLKFIAGEFEKLNKSIQTANINNSNIHQPKQMTAEEVLAEIVAPPKKGGK